ncbi:MULTISPECIES: class III extradiol dioxygenase family protein [Sphingobium]|uniref:class III extradiol dioxygenase family protein n=1 Tax=Sphingobium TaxID=165695 RepID=UPI0015EC6189|nr:MULTISPECIES: class III extradiol dioxygenase family protein [Sphingobium]MCW2363602.1 protocatechuate 4,5-dioxygenase beta chain [Sphingobium sp. B10D3B]MCW2403000.1 protocatechuate 4,5-dioxygenase beta chain [Sphingobium sp. B10D7B]MCW2409978.1 protocatechuate 4,5-dioxygenase beta chain [Sphingobium xanthum]
MAHILGGIFTSHVPAIGGAIARGQEQDPYWSPFFDGFKPIHRWLATARPDVAVVFYNDHGLNFFLDKMPTFAVGAADSYHNADEGWGLPVQNGFKGDAALSWHIIEGLVEDEFDVTTCQSMLVDHALVVPFQLSWPGGGQWPVRIVPIAINTVQHPLPSPKRCLALGRAVGKALRSWQGDERIVVFGTGGLSHQLDGERAGFINQRYDQFCMDNLGPDPDALTKISALDIVEEAGSQGIEIVNWIAARGGLGEDVAEVSRNYHIPISNTAAATMLLESGSTALEQAA